MKKLLFVALTVSLALMSCGEEGKSNTENENTKKNNSQLSEIVDLWEGPTSNSPGSPPHFYLDIRHASKGVVDAQYWIQYLGDQNPTKHNVTGSYEKDGDTIKILFDYSHLANEDNFMFTGAIIDGRSIMYCSYESEPNLIYWDFEIWKNEDIDVHLESELGKERDEDGTVAVTLKEDEVHVLKQEYKHIEARFIDFEFGDLAHYTFQTETGVQHDFNGIKDDSFDENVDHGEKYFYVFYKTEEFVHPEHGGYTADIIYRIIEK